MNEDQKDKEMLAPAKELAEIKLIRRLQSRKRPRKSKLAPYRGELTVLYNAGGSISDLVVWLRCRKKITVSRGSVHRILSLWPEVLIRSNKNA